MTVEITPRKKVFLTVTMIAASLLAVAAWSESRTMAFIATSSFGHARSLAEKKDGRVLQQFAQEANAVNSSETLVSVYAVGILLLSVASIVALWVPPRKDTEPIQALEPSTAVRPPDAGDRASGTRGSPDR